MSTERTLQDELQNYLNDKGVNQLFIKIVEQLLISKPDNPYEFIVDYLLKKFPNETSVFTRKDNTDQGQVIEKVDVQSDDDDDEDDDDEEDDVGDLVDMPQANSTSRGRRVSVSASVLSPTPNEIVSQVVFPKSPEETKHLFDIIKQNWLCAHLDPSQQKIVVDAMEKVSFDANVKIIEQGDTKAEHYFVLGSGTAEVHKDGKKVLDYEAGAGFGELALMYHAPRAATVTTTSPCDVWRLDRDTFKLIMLSTSMEKSSKHTSFLEKVPLLAEMEEYERLVLADALQPRTYKQGDEIITQNNAGDEFFIISEGTVNVFKDGKLISELGKSQYFGEIALLTDQKRQATIVAKSDVVEVLTVERKVFQRVLGPLSDILKRNMSEYTKIVSGVKL